MTNLIYIFWHFTLRKIIYPFRSYRWTKLRSPFKYRGEKNLSFILYPDEYIDRHIFIEGIYEIEILKYIEKILTDCRTMLDIGANIGNHTLYLSNVFNKIHSFEPNPLTIVRLNKNIAINQIRNVVVHPVGLGIEDALLPFVENNDGNLGCSHFQKNESDSTTLLNVKNGDSYLADLEISHIDFIKIDVEGFELDVLKGLEKTIKENNPIIMFEFHADQFKKNYFENFKQTLCGYTFIECIFGQQYGNYFDKFKFKLKMGSEPQLDVLHNLENRTYELILAIPSKNIQEYL